MHAAGIPYNTRFAAVDGAVCMLLMIDNYDSFTYNIVQYLAELGVEVKVIKNDELSVEQIRHLRPQRIVISPGPCTPSEAGVSMPAIRAFAGVVPILGICLGHQCIAQVLGGQVVRAKEVMHGKTSAIYHCGTGVFRRLPSPFVATRYHSLVVRPSGLPDELIVSAWTKSETEGLDEVMGIRHKTLPVEGVQFHPESILSEHGHRLLYNYLTL
jgi:anthranilate synthase component 2